jgi:hypothetical protein
MLQTKAPKREALKNAATDFAVIFANRPFFHNRMGGLRKGKTALFLRSNVTKHRQTNVRTKRLCNTAAAA